MWHGSNCFYATLCRVAGTMWHQAQFNLFVTATCEQIHTINSKLFFFIIQFSDKFHCIHILFIRLCYRGAPIEAYVLKKTWWNLLIIVCLHLAHKLSVFMQLQSSNWNCLVYSVVCFNCSGLFYEKLSGLIICTLFQSAALGTVIAIGHLQKPQSRLVMCMRLNFPALFCLCLSFANNRFHVLYGWNLLLILPNSIDSPTMSPSFLCKVWPIKF